MERREEREGEREKERQKQRKDGRQGRKEKPSNFAAGELRPSAAPLFQSFCVRWSCEVDWCQPGNSGAGPIQS